MPLLPTLPPRRPDSVDVVTLGECSVDLVCRLDTWPQANAKGALREFAVLPGGQAATVAVGCARLGWRARFIGAIGDDGWGSLVRSTLARERIDARLVRRRRTPSRIAVVLVAADGRRTILECSRPGLPLRAREVAASQIAGGRVLMVDATSAGASVAAARAARAAGMPVVLDVEREEAGLERLLRMSHVIIAAGSFPAAWTGARGVGKALRRLRDLTSAELVVATLGEEGSLAWDGRREWRAPAFRAKIVDTTGAGDAFRAGFIAAWLQYGSKASLDRLLRFASVAAGLNCGALGAQAGLPTRAAVKRHVTAGSGGRSNVSGRR